MDQESTVKAKIVQLQSPREKAHNETNMADSSASQSPPKTTKNNARPALTPNCDALSSAASNVQIYMN
mgnify:FL=1